jgi:peptide/nickel transport system substrate-binding protein
MADLATYDLIRRNLKSGPSRRAVLGLLGGAAIAGSLTSPARAAIPVRGGRIRVATESSSTADTLDPVRSAQTTDYVRIYAHYSCLTTLDAKLVPQPELAETFTTSDALTWSFSLRKGVTFHDGSSLTPADVVYSLNRVKDPATGSIARALAVQMEQITADGADKVSIKLSSPNADLPSILGTMHFAIVKDGTTDFSKGNGTGAFLCKEFQPGVRSLAVRNPNYWKPGKPYLDELEIFSIQDETARLNALMAGDIQIAAKLSMRFAQRAKTAANVAVFETPSGGYNDFILRQDAELTRNPDLVLALKYLQDRKQLQALVGGVIANDQPIDPSSRYFDPTLPQRPFDPEKAKFHLRKAGIGSTPLPLYVMAGNTMADQALLLQQSALQAGLKIDLQRMPKDGYWSSVWFKHPFTGGSINPRPSADALLTLMFKSDSAWNESGWKSERFDSLLIQARGETDETKRKAMYSEMQQTISDQGSILIPNFLSFYDAHSTKVGGLTPIPLGALMGFGFAENVWLAT